MPDQDSVALTPVWEDQTFHRYLKMINENEIEIDYLQQSPIFKKISANNQDKPCRFHLPSKRSGRGYRHGSPGNAQKGYLEP